MLNWNPWAIKIYLQLLAMAQQQDTTYKGLLVKRGQILISLRKLGERLKYPIEQDSLDGDQRFKEIPLTTLTRYLQRLEKDRLVSTQTVQFGTLITILNYEACCVLPANHLVQPNLRDKLDSISSTNSSGTSTNTTNKLYTLLEYYNTSSSIPDTKRYGRELGLSREDIDRVIDPAPPNAFAFTIKYFEEHEGRKTFEQVLDAYNKQYKHKDFREEEIPF